MTAPDAIDIEGRRYLLASSLHGDDRTRVLKHGDSFGVFDLYGDIRRTGAGEQGVFHTGTRYLSRLELSINRVRPLLLNSSVKNDNTLLAVDLTNPLIAAGDGPPLAYATLHIFRARVLWEGACYEHLRLTNYGGARIDFDLALEFDADFSNIFEVRGKCRSRRGVHLSPESDESSVTLSYCGLDGVIRRTRITAEGTPHRCSTPMDARRTGISPSVRCRATYMRPGARPACWPGASAIRLRRGDSRSRRGT